MVFDKAHRKPELHRTVGLALREPARVPLKNRKHLLVPEDRFALGRRRSGVRRATEGSGLFDRLGPVDNWVAIRRVPCYLAAMHAGTAAQANGQVT